MPDFPTRKLEEIVDRVCVGYVGSCNNDYTESGVGVPMVRTTNLTGTIVNYQDMKFISNDFHKKNIKSQLKKGDILVARHGDSGLPSIYESENEANCLNVVIVKPSENENLIDNYYILYALKSPFVVRQIKSAVGGSVQGVVNTKVIARLDIPYPERSIRVEIVKHIINLDRKIQLNRQTNQTLEQIAQAIFKSWFVDFDPVKAKIQAKQNGQDPELAAMCAISGLSTSNAASVEEQLKGLDDVTLQQLKTTAALFPDALVESELGEIPEGWKCSEIGKEVTVVGGGTPSTKNNEYWEGGHIHWTTPRDMSNLTDKILLDTGRKITKAGLAKISSGLLPKNTVLMSSRAPVGYLAIAKVPVAINQGYIAMKCESDLTPEYVVQWAESVMDEIKQRASGTTFAEISKKNFRVIPVIVPDGNVIREFSKVVSKIYGKITEGINETKSLTKIRDTLLPKLLSGEMDLVG
ncbi:restriction endonuclease subunit S [Haliea sp. AH-315-K21]|uniref:Protein HsdA n=1 Tax=SAR86 cluster bacterium TaxID=2030880 RepID=A0A2A5CH80_9GAMM|nr:restriction endonuclease subunit S [Haliea sp. AH-315-K21]MBN4075650.1 restriction endonuclease subunit S [Gammaproteobacteria bacterium AH-315-E17]PCJ42888.1 MAG: protein HsdA [SAR86 cluster bacterium]